MVPRGLMACIPCVGLVGSSGSRGEDTSPREAGHWVGTVCPDRDESCQPGPIVQVVVKATPGQSGDQLRYQCSTSKWLGLAARSLTTIITLTGASTGVRQGNAAYKNCLLRS